MKIYTIISAILLLFFSAILILGVLSGSESVIRVSGIIEAPQVVVLKVLLDFDNYNQWWVNLKKQSLNSDLSGREATYLIRGEMLTQQENIQYIPSANLFLFTQSDSVKRSLIQNLNQEISVTELPDGTTEVIWQTRYHIRPISGKFLNTLFIKPSLNSITYNNLQSLKNLIERL